VTPNEDPAIATSAERAAFVATLESAEGDSAAKLHQLHGCETEDDFLTRTELGLPSEDPGVLVFVHHPSFAGRVSGTLMTADPEAGRSLFVLLPSCIGMTLEQIGDLEVGERFEKLG
jgi:hypothetical protein